MPIMKNAYNELKRRSRDHFLIAYNEIFGMTKKIVLKIWKNKAKSWPIGASRSCPRVGPELPIVA